MNAIAAGDTFEDARGNHLESFTVHLHNMTAAQHPGLVTRLARLCAVLALCASVLVAAAARGQCQGQWLPSGDVLAGLNGSAGAAVEWDPDGAGPQAPLLVVGGTFTFAGDLAVRNIVGWDGAHWVPIGTGVNDTVYALAVGSNGELIVGGRFTAAGSIDANGVARWDGSTWSAYGGGLVGNVFCLAALPGGGLVAGGDFTQGGLTRIARWNGSAWTGLSTGMSWGNNYSSVRSVLVLSNGDIVAGGDFTTAGGVTVNAIARWNGTAWSAMGGGVTPLFYGVDSLVQMPNGDVVAGGRFQQADGHFVYGIARWNGTAWSNLRSGIQHQGQGGSFNGDVRSLLVLPNGDLMVAGLMNSAGGVPTTGVARWDGTDWWAFSTNSAFAVGAITRRANGDLVIAGSPGMVGNSCVAVWTGAAWAGLNGQASAYVDGDMTVLTALPGGGFAAGGTFTHIGGVTVNQLAVWGNESWSPMGVGMSSGGIVTALTPMPNGDIIVGGTFGVIGGIDAFNIARWDGAAWHPLGSGFNAGVNAMAVLNDGRLVVSGAFTTAGGAPANHLAIWNGTVWAPFGAGTSGSGAIAICMLVMPDGQLYIAGGFTTVDGVAANRIARWDGAWHPLSSGINGLVRHLAAFHNDVIASGDFSSAGGWPMSVGIARWNGSDYQQVFAGSPSVGAIATMPNGDLLLARVQGSDGNVSRWDGATWTTVGMPRTPGNSYNVYALAPLAGGDMVVGGDFTQMQGRPSAHFARYAVPTADFNHDGDIGTDQDIEAFFACLAGDCCTFCPSSDFDGDGDLGTDADIESFFRVLAGGPC